MQLIKIGEDKITVVIDQTTTREYSNCTYQLDDSYICATSKYEDTTMPAFLAGLVIIGLLVTAIPVVLTKMLR